MLQNKNNIKITDDDIIYAEKILLGKDEHFDIERRDFITNLDTIDLQAVPGSGKTTALLAKLIILESKMPFSNGSGILVLSHTNTAVDEIKNRLGKIAPKLFQFPNYIGTIQSFVDEFLTKPHLVSKGVNIDFIDSERQKNSINNHIYSYFDGIDNEIKTNILNIKMDNPKKIVDSYLLFDYGIKLHLDGKEIEIKKPKGRSNPNTYIDWLIGKKKKVYNGIVKLKINLIKSGKLSYEDAYFVGFKYLESFPKIIKILQKRFQFVFVDEMQDMEQHQVNILEKIFYKKRILNHCFQRIGDKNQAIYNGGEINVGSEWIGGKRKDLYLKGTHRLTQSVANVSKNFGVEFIDFKGKRNLKKKDGTQLDDIKPIMLVYKTEHLNDENPECKENQVLKEFTKIINEKKGEGYFEDVRDDKLICKAVIWNAKSQENNDGTIKFERDKCRAKHYFFDYDVEGGKSKNKPWLKTHKDYLYYYDRNDISYKSKNHNIWRLLLRILRENYIKNPETGKIFSRKETLLEYLKRNNSEKYLEIKSKIYDWTKRLNDTIIDEISQEMDEYYYDDFFVNFFEKNLTKTIFNSVLSSNTDITEEKTELNIFKSNGLEIVIGNVHSVKGETHTCTLYMESCYKPPSRGVDRINKGYESMRLTNFFIGGNSITNNISSENLKLQSMKMLYVGLSRSTHLLCYAIHEDRYNQIISGTGNEEKLNDLWEIKKIWEIN